MDTAAKTGLGALKTASKKVVHKAVEETGEFIGNRIADQIVKPKPMIDFFCLFSISIYLPFKSQNTKFIAIKIVI